MGHGALPILLRRLALVPIIVFIVAAATYALTHVAPGDPVRIIGGARQVEPQQAELIREEFGLHGTYFERFGRYVWGVASRGDLGPSYYYRSPKRSVQELLAERIWVSAQINIMVLVLIFGIGIPIGVYVAVHRGTWKDPTIIGFLKIFDSIPSPIMIVLVIFLMVEVLDPIFDFLGFNVPSIWTPGDPASYIIPLVAMSIGAFGGMGRFVRISMLATMQDDYVRTARAKGLSERAVLYRHVLRNGLLPLSTNIGLAFVGVIVGSIVVETRYGIPGVGAFIFESITQRDWNVILGFTLLVATLIIIANALVDIAYIFIDPRIRFTERVA